MIEHPLLGAQNKAGSHPRSWCLSHSSQRGWQQVRVLRYPALTSAASSRNISSWDAELCTGTHSLASLQLQRECQGMLFGPHEAHTGPSPELSLEQEGRCLSCCSQQSQITAKSPAETHLPDQWGFAFKNPSEVCGVWIPHLHALKCTCRGGECGLVWAGTPEQSLSQTC